MLFVIATEFGAIEVDQTKSCAYFKGQDYEATIDCDGTFKDMMGRTFRVLWPQKIGHDCLIEVLTFKTIGRAVYP